MPAKHDPCQMVPPLDGGGMETVDVCCPTCGEWFAVTRPPSGELPCQVDYDCEVCCRPMVLWFAADGDARAVGIGE
jgi:hypothetical protein